MSERVQLSTEVAITGTNRVLTYTDRLRLKVGRDFYVGQDRYVVVLVDESDPMVLRAKITKSD